MAGPVWVYGADALNRTPLFLLEATSRLDQQFVVPYHPAVRRGYQQAALP